TGQGDDAGIVALEKGLPRIQLEAAFLLAAPVTFNAARFKNRTDVAPKINRVRGRRRQPGDLFGSQPGLRTDGSGTKEREEQDMRLDHKETTPQSRREFNSS